MKKKLTATAAMGLAALLITAAFITACGVSDDSEPSGAETDANGTVNGPEVGSTGEPGKTPGTADEDKNASSGSAPGENEASDEDGLSSSAENAPTDDDNIEDDGYYTANPVMKYGTVSSVDAEGGSVMISEAGAGAAAEELGDNDIIFLFTPDVPIVDAVSGLPAEISGLKEGDFVYAWAGDTMTLSLPPQTNLQAMAVNIPADSAAPMYVVAADVRNDDEGQNVIITDQDGNEYVCSDTDGENAVAVTPFITRQIVKLSDITAGSRMMIWAEDGEASKIVLFN